MRHFLLGSNFKSKTSKFMSLKSERSSRDFLYHSSFRQIENKCHRVVLHRITAWQTTLRLEENLFIVWTDLKQVQRVRSIWHSSWDEFLAFPRPEKFPLVKKNPRLLFLKWECLQWHCVHHLFCDGVRFWKEQRAHYFEQCVLCPPSSEKNLF